MTVFESISKFSSLVDLLQERAARQPDQCAFRFLPAGDGSELFLTYAQLDHKAQGIAAALQGMGMTGERALLLFPPGLDYIAAFFGCIYAGVVAVPAYPPNPNRFHRSMSRIRAIIADADVKLVVTISSIFENSREHDTDPVLKSAQWLATDHLDPRLAGGWTPPSVSEDSLAFLQYTSGSTSAPKGVMVSHGNLLHNEKLICKAFENGPDDLVVGWLPLYHDMGLIGNVLQPIYLGVEAVLMSPVRFLSNPFSWLEAISRFSGTISGGPDFAFAYCVQRIKEAQKSNLDLRSWRVAFNGSEPIRAQTLEAFTRAFAPCGFRAETFVPCYGMAECTLIISSNKPTGLPIVTAIDNEASSRSEVIESTDAKSRRVVGCGHAIDGLEVRIVDPESRRVCPAGKIGEVWVRGGSVAKGYFNRPELTAQTFDAYLDTGQGPFMRTGDLAFFHGEELHISGRLKDLIIIRGRNYYPQDIELTVEKAYAGLRQGCGAAFSTSDESGNEQLVIVQEAPSGRDFDTSAAISAIGQAISEQHEIQAHAIVLIRARGLPKTTSGKVQRRACRQAWLNKELRVLDEQTRQTSPGPNPRASANFSMKQALALIGHPESRTQLLCLGLQQQLSAVLGGEPEDYPFDRPLNAMGLDSVTAIELQHKLENELAVVLPMAAFLKGPTIEEAAAQILAKLEVSPQSFDEVIPMGQLSGPQPLSLSQRSMWFLNRMNPESPAYHIVQPLKLVGQLDLELLHRAFENWRTQHAVLRTRFLEVDGEPSQVFDEDLPLDFHIEQVSDLTMEALIARLEEEAYRPFELKRDAPLRLRLFRVSEEEHYLLVVLHHIIADFWSLGIMVRELHDAYTTGLRGAEPRVMPSAITYNDYVHWQDALMAGREGEELADYWKEKLGGELPLLALPTDRPRSLNTSHNGAAVIFTLPADQSAELNDVAHQRSTTTFVLLLAAYQTLLYRYTGQDELIIGTPTTGRTRAQLSDLVGYFVNPVAIRGDLSGDPSFNELLDRTRAVTLDAFIHQDYPFPLLVERLAPERGTGYAPIFQTMFVLQSAPFFRDTGLSQFALGVEGASFRMGELNLVSVPLSRKFTQFDLTMQVATDGESLSFSLEYNTDLFDAETVVDMARHFRTLLAGIVSGPQRRLSELPLLGENERQLILHEWNQTRAVFPKKPVHRQFEEHAAANPDHLALCFDSGNLTYGDLDRRANALAMQLRHQGLASGDRVAVCFERGPDLILAILAVLKAGAAYVPMDPRYPRDRISHMVTDSGARLLLSHEHLAESLPELAFEPFFLDWCQIDEVADPVVHINICDNNPAYLIYTSGSSGKPNGVVISHGSLSNLATWHRSAYGVGAADLACLTAGPGFDASAWEIWSYLGSGATIHVPDDETLIHPDLLWAWLNRQRITITFLATPLAEALLAEPFPEGTALSRLLTGADRFHISERFPTELPFALYNNYGPTENTVVSTMALVDPRGPALPPIGRPLPNTQAYVLDRSFRVLPIGVHGELFLGGDQVACAYHGQPVLTATRFLPDPFSSRPGSRLFRTGDGARFDRKGNIHFLGRLDFQVKIRGFRIELAEIETVLDGAPGVGKSMVLLRKSTRGEAMLVAYMTREGQEPIQEMGLKAILRQSLPDYMVPSAFMFIDRFPLTPNGKVDRRALPNPSDTAAVSTAPRNRVEKEMVRIWAELFGLEEVGIHDNFFELGGHSLIAARLQTRLNQALNLDLPLRSVFHSPTVAALAELAATDRQVKVLDLAPIEPARGDEPLMLSHGQERLWFLDQLEKAITYHMPAALSLHGDLDTGALERALVEIVRRHQVLRTIFPSRQGKPYAQALDADYAARVAVFPHLDLRDTKNSQEEVQRLAKSEALKAFDLAVGPLLRFLLLRVEDRRWVLLSTMHHIVADGWSLGVIMRELEVLYPHFRDVPEEPVNLPELSIQFTDYARWQRSELEEKVFEGQLAYWQDRLADAPVLLMLPQDRPRPTIPSYRGASEHFHLDKDLCRRLELLGRQQGATLFMTFQSVFAVLLTRYSACEDILLGSPVANRARPELEPLVGFFANSLVLRNDLSGNPSFERLLQRIRESDLEAFENADLPFSKVVAALQPERNLAHSPLFQVMFSMNDFTLASLDLGGLELHSSEIERGTANFDLTLDLGEDDSGVKGALEYSLDLYDGSRIRAMIGHFQVLLEAVVQAPETPIWDLPLMRDDEKKQLLEEWAGRVAVRNSPCVHRLFEVRVASHPQASAIEYEGVNGHLEVVTYADLESRTNRLAHHLLRLGAGMESRVGICMTRSPEMIVALMAVHKAGAAFVPIDPALPKERINYMLADAGIELLVTQGRHKAQLADFDCQLIDMDNERGEMRDLPDSAPGLVPHYQQLAYIIYTSGSTGRPKGVAVSHGALNAFLHAAIVDIDFREDDRVLKFMSISFDASLEEVFCTLAIGATMVLRTDEMVSSSRAFFRKCEDWGITVLDLPTAFWHQLAADVTRSTILPPKSIRLIIIGGERVNADLVTAWCRQVGSRIRFINSYGPTEATVASTFIDLAAPGIDCNFVREVPVGRPYSDSQIYILDPKGNPLPSGVSGELAIAGVSLARGYRGQPGRTAAVFVPNPFAATPAERLYLTGDRARFLSDGNVELEGRLDNQIKLRGFRIEPGEIESALVAVSDVDAAVIHLWRPPDGEPGSERLVAYVQAPGLLANSVVADPVKYLRDELDKKLPAYMVPSEFFVMDAFPVTTQGKLDRHNLPKPSTHQTEVVVDEPRSELEADLTAIWAEILGRQKVGIQSNFFDLGGHSLLVTQVISRIYERFAVELSLREFFGSPTIQQQAVLIEASMTSTGRGLIPLVVDRRDQPLSFAQQRLWFLEQLDETGAAYHLPFATRIEGDLDVSVLEHAMTEIRRRHEVLRTTFVAEDGHPLQRIAEPTPWLIPVSDLRDRSETAARSELDDLARALTFLPFDLAQGPLMRLRLVRLEADSYVLLGAIHHIIADGWSVAILMRELTVLYSAFVARQPSPLAELAVQYLDYAAYQKDSAWLAGQTRDLDFWLDRLSGAPALSTLPPDRPRAEAVASATAISFRFDSHMTEALERLARSQDATLFMLLHCALACLLARHADQYDLVIGTPVANRNRREIEPLIGFFVNTLALRTDLSGDPHFSELLQQVRRDDIDAFAHQNLPFERLVETLNPERQTSLNPIFQVMLAFQSTPQEDLQLADLKLTPMEAVIPEMGFDMQVSIEWVGGELMGTWVYADALYQADTIDRLIRHFRTLLEGVAAHPETRLSALPLIGEEERHRLLHAFNQTERDYAERRSIHQFFEEQAALAPPRTALVFEGETLTYGELNSRANQLAHTLIQEGLCRGELVGVCLERSFELVVSLLAVLKAGGAYLPLEPGYPLERLRFMTQDAHLRLVLTGADQPDFGLDGLKRLDPATLDPRCSSSNPSLALSAADLAYMIYTSGSTGRPKGVMVSHGAIANRLLWMQEGYKLKRDDHVLQKTPFSFDVSVWEFFWPLMVGARLVLARPDGHRDPAYLQRLMAEQGISVCHFVPSMLRAFLEQDRLNLPDPLRTVFCSGEALDADLRNRFLDRSSAQLHNLYGPTEAAVDVTFWHCSPELRDEVVPIGHPIANIRTYVLDSQLEPVPIGVPGELYLAGAGLARGYLFRPGLSAASFIPDPHGQVAGARLYRTGDRARFRADGAILFMGRIDDQVKLRGFRIELGEITAALLTFPEVKSAVTVVCEDDPGNPRLVGYITYRDNLAVDQVIPLRQRLRDHLPQYMIPSELMVLDAMPLTANGKLDRKALPKPTGFLSAKAAYVAPRSETEKILAVHWQELLKHDQIGVHDSFFDLGGHSLLVTRVVSRIRQEFGVELSVSHLFEATTLAQLAQLVDETRDREIPALPPLQAMSREGELPLSFVQQRLWFMAQIEEGAATYNMPSVLELRGQLNVMVLVRSLNEICRRHESLRTSFPSREGQPVQVIAEPAPATIRFLDLSDLSGKTMDGEIRALHQHEARVSFDLARGPLVRFSLLRLSEKLSHLMITFHHIISDAWSMGVMIEECRTLYNCYSFGEESPLPELPIQYVDYACWQRGWLRDGVLQQQLDYWMQALADAPPLLDLPTDRPRPQVQRFRGRTLGFRMPSGLVDRLQMIGAAQGATLFMTLETAFAAFLARLSGQTDILFGSPVANRNIRQVEGLIGFFVNTLVLRHDLSNDPGFTELLAQARCSALAAYTHQEIPYEHLVEVLQPERNPSYNPIFQVMFEVQDPLELGGQLTGLTLVPLEIETNWAKVDMIVSLQASDGELRGVWEYSTDLFDEQTIDTWIGYFTHFLEAIAAEPQRPLATLPLLSEEKATLLLTTINDTSYAYPRDRSIVALFSEQVDRHGQDEALTFGEVHISYAELDARSNLLAASLLENGVGLETRVGIYAQRSPEMVIAQLAVLKVGGVYVPLDPTLPEERLSFQMKDANIETVLAASVPEQVPGSATWLQVSLMGEWRDAPPLSAPAPCSANLAYIIFTSGSTGKPKGVGVPHFAVNRLVRNTNYIDLQPGMAVAHAANVAFDAATFEIWGPLLNGGRVVGIPADLALSAKPFASYLRQHQVGVLFLTTALLNQLVEQKPDFFACLDTVLFGGEAVNPERIRQLLAQGAPRRLLHVYGPTESTTFATWHLIETVAEQAATIPIGLPLGNTNMVVVNRGFQMVPRGTPGELLLGGDGLARGYDGRPGLTAEKFVPNPFSDQPGARLYRTGDLVEWDSQGRVSFRGRMDHQVKLRGFRIELGEIDAALIRHPLVRDAAVLLRNDDLGKRLVGYLQLIEESEHAVDEVRAYLRMKLPEFMLPSVYVVLDHFPMTPSGKLDRKRLPAPPSTLEEDRYVAPRTEIEHKLVEMWTSILKLERIGIEDNFFEIGGHSLLATQLISRIRLELSLEIPLRDLFIASTIKALAERIESHQKATEQPSLPPIERVERQAFMPVSFGQQGLWFLNELEGPSATYNIPVVVELSGPLKKNLLKQSLQALVQRHEILRTTFVLKDGAPVQVIAPTWRVIVPVQNLLYLEGEEQKVELRRIIAEEVGRSFELGNGPMIRVNLVRLGKEKHVLIITMHHIVTDGWSMHLLIRDLGTFYRAAALRENDPLPPLPIQYADYAHWQRTWIGEAALSGQLAFWEKQLAGAPALLELPSDRPRPALQNFSGAMENFHISAELTAKLRQVNKSTDTTLFMLLLAVYKVLLNRYSGSEDLVVGTPIANRNRVETEQLIGYFSNTLVLRTDMSGQPSFETLLGRVRDVCLDAFSHQDVPFDQVVDTLKPVRNMGYNPICQVLFVLQNIPTEQSEIPDLTVTPMHDEHRVSKFDLTLTIDMDGDGLYGSVEYRTDLWEAKTIRRLIDHYLVLLENCLTNKDTPIGRLPILPALEKELLAGFSGEPAVYPQQSIQYLFEQQVQRSPKAIAVVLEEQTLTYDELNRQANNVAHKLAACGVGNGDLVGLCVPRSVDMIVALLGILKAGAAYMPLDSEYPQERLSFMLSDSEIGCLIATNETLELLPAFEINFLHLLVLDEDDDLATVEMDANPVSHGDGDFPAYLMYTSGSTGQPKGTIIPHRAVLRLVLSTNYIELSEATVMLQMAPVSFDAATLEIWGPLLHGGRCVLYPERVPTSAVLSRILPYHKINTLWLTASLFNMMIDEAPQALSGVVQLLAGGEALSVPHVRRALAELPETRLINGYGPTESTTFACCHPIDRDGMATCTSIPIGRPITNTRVHILHANLEATPIGIPGELYIGGDGLANGYHARPALTAQRFVPDPLDTSGGGRLYRSGDLTRFLPDGRIEFLGRLDHQVKVRGFRIEPGEIEAALIGHADVENAVVLAREITPDNKQLVAFIQAKAHFIEQSTRLEGDSLRVLFKDFLGQSLPDYMIPNLYVLLEQMPLTANGKVDRSALPEIDRDGEKSGGFMGPRTVTEEILASIWSDLLGIEQVDINVDFFELGGHSLLATQVVSRIREFMGSEMPLSTLFENSTIATLAEKVDANRRQGNATQLPPIQPAPSDEPAQLSFSQQRLLFIEQLEDMGTTFNIMTVLKLSGSIDLEALQCSSHEILQRHSVLRSFFPSVGDGHRIALGSVDRIPFNLVDLTGLEQMDLALQRIAEMEANRPFDLERGPLFRATLLRLGEKDHVLFINMHHLVSDAWSMQILIRELGAIYAAFVSGGLPSLPPLPIQYSDFAYWQRRHLAGEHLDQQLAYWKGKLSGKLPLLQLAGDADPNLAGSHSGEVVSFKLSEQLTIALRQLSRKQDVTLFMCLLAVFKTLLHRLTEADDIIIGTPIAGRQFSETERLIGCFLNTLVLRTRIEENMSFVDLLSQLRQTTLDAFVHQDLPFERLVEEIQPERNIDRHPIFDIMFNFMNTSQAPLEMPGLRLEPVQEIEPNAKYALTFYIEEHGDVLFLKLVYKRALFSHRRMEQFFRQYCYLLEQVVVDANKALTAFSLVEPEAEAVLPSLLQPPPARTDQISIPDQFKAIVARHPQCLAVTRAGQGLSYAELETLTASIAALLTEHGIKKGQVVAVEGEPDAALIAAILAILRNEHVLLTLDINLPPERRDLMLSEAGTRCLISVGLSNRPRLDMALLQMEPGSARPLSFQEREGVTAECQPLSPEAAYIFFTSGTTGVPKGVLGSKRGLAHFLNWQRSRFELGVHDRCAQVTGLSFDVVLRDMLLPLTSGASLWIPDGSAGFPPMDALAWMDKEQITVCHMVPSLARAWMTSATADLSLDKIRVIFFAGEPLMGSLLEQWHRLFPLCRAQLVNLYGPTETTLAKCYFVVPDQPLPGSQPVGNPIPDTQTLILRPDGGACGFGEPGEVVFRTPFRSLGYFNEAKLGTLCFSPNPHRDDAQDLIYYSGDKGYYLPDGSIALRGRMDHQVKIRGVRIEPGEIENALIATGEVSEAAVIARAKNKGQLELIAYVVFGKTSSDSSERLLQLRRVLRGRLPGAMVPAHLVAMEALPLNNNGKLDRGALPEPGEPLPEDAYVAPRGETEKVLARIWTEVLGVERVGIYDNFFDIGGHSLLANQILARMRQHFPMECSLIQIFREPTVAALAGHIDKLVETVGCLAPNQEASIENREEIAL